MWCGSGSCAPAATQLQHIQVSLWHDCQAACLVDACQWCCDKQGQAPKSLCHQGQNQGADQPSARSSGGHLMQLQYGTCHMISCMHSLLLTELACKFEVTVNNRMTSFSNKAMNAAANSTCLCKYSMLLLLGLASGLWGITDACCKARKVTQCGMQGPLLANYSQSFIEQLRAASSPYSPSTAGARRRLPFAQESHLQRLSMWLSVTFKQRLPWGAAAAQRRRKFMASFLVKQLLLVCDQCGVYDHSSAASPWRASCCCLHDWELSLHDQCGGAVS